MKNKAGKQSLLRFLFPVFWQALSLNLESVVPEGEGLVLIVLSLSGGVRLSQ